MRASAGYGPLIPLFVLVGLTCLAGDDEATYDAQRHAMVKRQIEARGVTDEKVLEALRKVPRHKFVLKRHLAQAYADRPLPIGEGQTISQPYVVALMTEVLRLKPDDKVLEIGTGSGYQAAVLGELCNSVYSIEIVDSLGKKAAGLLKKLGYKTVTVKIGDGYKGWPEHQPFDAIIVTCAPTNVPAPLTEQLAEGGRMIIPVGESFNQELVLLTKEKGKLKKHNVLPVRFVPMVDEKRRTY